MAKCPWCGNRNRKYIESNLSPGERGEETLLCVAPVPVGEESFDWDLIADSPSHQGICGYQWDVED
jgi:hypothetical protein